MVTVAGIKPDNRGIAVGNGHYDKEDVRTSAKGRWIEIIHNVARIDSSLLDGKGHPCPKCGEGKDRFALLDSDAGAVHCRICFNTRNGDGFATVGWMLNVGFDSAVRLVAEYLRVQSAQLSTSNGTAAAEAKPRRELRLLEWNGGLRLFAKQWCEKHKQGTSLEAMLACGARRGIYGKTAVWAFPVRRISAGGAIEVCGHCLYRTDGQYFGESKCIVSRGTQPGFVGPIEQLSSASLVVKLEGTTDVLAFLSMPGLPSDVIALTNSSGAKQKNAPWDNLRGKSVVVLHDADKPGLHGAIGQEIDGKHRPGCAELISVHAETCRHAQLPYPVEESDGKDFRVWVNEGHYFGDFEKLIESASVVASAQAIEVSNDSPVSTGKTQPTEQSARPQIDIARWLTDRSITFRVQRPGDGRSLYLLSRCVFNASHVDDGACFIQESSGRTTYKCSHKSCAGRSWQGAKLALGPPDPQHYDPPLGSHSTAVVLTPGTRVRALDRDNFGEVVEDCGRNVVVHFQSPDGNSATKSLPRTSLILANGTPVATGATFAPKLLTSAQFEAGNYDRRYLVKQVLVAGQHGIIGGRYKTLKTSIAVDMAVSLGTGTPFLDAFDTVRARAAVLSGESGEGTLQETARRVCDSRGVSLSAADILWGFELPQIGRANDLDALAGMIESNSVEVLFIDPAYLCLLAGDMQGKQAGNLFEMGPVLLGLSDVARWTDCTVVMLHHCRKNTTDIFAPPELDELAMAGFAEWARQWLLIGRREVYEQDSGLHKLWLNIGGSTGHSGCWAIDVNEGVLGDDFTGRKWDVEVKRTGDAKKEAVQQRERKRALDREQKEEEYRCRLLKSLGMVPDGETAHQLRAMSGLNSANFGIAISFLVSEGRAEACDLVKGNKTFQGFKPTGK